MSTILVDTINEKTSGNGVSIDGHIINYKRHFFFSHKHSTTNI